MRGPEEYPHILDLLTQAAKAKPATLTLDLRRSISQQFRDQYPSKFVLHVRKHNTSKIVIKGNRQYPWQRKSLTNFQRLLPALQLEIA